jgi:hypothetical protein
MNVLSLTCNHCGAPLQVEEGTRYLTCRFCSSQLEVQHSENAFYTKVLQVLDQRTSEMAKDLDVIKRQNQLEQLERDWQREREDYLVRGQNGTTTIPSAAGSLIGMAIGIAIGVLWVGFTSSLEGVPGFFPFFGVLVIIAVVFGSLRNLQKSIRYREREAEYHRRRQEFEGSAGAY